MARKDRRGACRAPSDPADPLRARLLRAWWNSIRRGPAHHLAPAPGRAGCSRVRVGGLWWHGRNGAVRERGRLGGGCARVRHGRDGAVGGWRRGGGTPIRMRRSRLGHVSSFRQRSQDGRGLELSFRPGRHARELSPLPPGQDPGPAASIRYREGQPRRGITSLMRTDDHVDRAMFMSSSGNPG